MRKQHALDSIHSDALTFGRIMPLRSMIGGKGRCRENHEWHFVPQCLADQPKPVRRPREDWGKHISAFSPSASAPKAESFYERNMRLGYVGRR
jgi:hypothetical protein